MILTVPLEFAYVMQVRRPRQRKPRARVFRASENLHFESLRASDTEVAYRIKNTEDAEGPVDSEVRRYRDRLWWPWDGYGSGRTACARRRTPASPVPACRWCPC